VVHSYAEYVMVGGGEEFTKKKEFIFIINMILKTLI